MLNLPKVGRRDQCHMEPREAWRGRGGKRSVDGMVKEREGEKERDDQWQGSAIGIVGQDRQTVCLPFGV